MPIIKSAKKKLRQDKNRTQNNLLVKKTVKAEILAYKRKPIPSALVKVFSVLDTAAKKKVYHSNKVARLKSRLSKLLGKKFQKTVEKSKTTTKPHSPPKAKISV